MKNYKKNGGEMSFGLEIILFVIGLFIVWVLVGKPESENVDKPFIKERTVMPQRLP